MTIVCALAACGRETQARALMACGRYFQRINFPCGTYKLLPHYCDSVFCPDCAARRAKPLIRKLLDRLNPTKYAYFMLTITVRNWPELTRENIDGFLKQFARLRGTRLWKEIVRGGIYSIETTYNPETCTWHPHLHVLIESRLKFIPEPWLGKLKSAWLEITGDSHVINLERAYGRGKGEKGRKTRKINRRALKELVKYATKSVTFGHSPALVDQFLTAFENVRRMQSFGSFLGAQKEADKETNAETNPMDYKPGEFAGCACGMCRWRDGIRASELVHVSQTVLAFDGTRQLRLFDSGVDPPQINALELVKILSDESNHSAVALPTLFDGQEARGLAALPF